MISHCHCGPHFHIWNLSCSSQSDAFICEKIPPSYLGMLEQIFGDLMSFLTKPARIREKTLDLALDLATSSAAVEFRLCAIRKLTT